MQHSVIMGGEPFGLGLEEKLLPQFLKELGYATHAVGKVQIWIFLIYHKSRLSICTFWWVLQHEMQSWVQ